MITHFVSIHIDLLDVVENGNYIPLDEQLNEVPRARGQKLKNKGSC